ncbi:MAG: NADH-quinone oxidoreductase subunit NuoF [Symbiobacteriaceae bacterium]|nr:NADH-quinone oxidoreductase subunit NuoF [Symbiobacteriaceae bacterium]
MNILVCGGPACKSTDSDHIITQLRVELQKAGLAEEVKVVPAGCMGYCAQGPVLKVQPDNTFYVQVKATDAAEIVQKHILNHQYVERLMFHHPASGAPCRQEEDIPFFQGQVRIALRNCGVVDPAYIEDYISLKGYQGLVKAMEIGPDATVAMIKQAGLRGRGGAGFPTGTKWEFTQSYTATPKYVVCNADEGDPGAFMDRCIMEGDPHSVLEAMAIAGHSIGAAEGVIYVRAEYPLAVQSLQTAIKQAEEFGLLGENILGTGFNFSIRLNLGAGAFVCGEETALLSSIEGNRGEPRVRPPYPAEKGLWGQPTVLNNVETYANVPAIMLRGAAWFSSYGTAGSKGTKVFALAGKINNIGLIEVPMGTTLDHIINHIGGGIQNNRAFKAVQTGGPSGGCMPTALLQTEVDYESLTQAGSMMGSGGMIVLDEDDCMVNIAKYFLEFTVDESCGRCTPCRIGTKRLYEMLERITTGKGTNKDIVDLQELGDIIRDCSLCGLGQTAPNPVISTLRYFKDEYIAHVEEHRCPALACTELLTFTVVADKCIGCTVCARNCPADAISGVVRAAHTIDPDKCVKCGICLDKCPTKAIIRY